MPLPIPLALAAGGAFLAGSIFGRERTDAAVVVNTAPETNQSSAGISLRNGLLLGGSALAVLAIAPRITGGKK